MTNIDGGWENLSPIVRGALVGLAVAAVLGLLLSGISGPPVAEGLGLRPHISGWSVILVCAMSLAAGTIEAFRRKG